MKTIPIIAAILVYPLVLNAVPNGGKHKSGTHRIHNRSSGPTSNGNGSREETEEKRVFSNEGSAAETTTTTTIIESSSSSSSTTLIGGEIFGLSISHDYVCDCSDCVQHTYDLTDEDLHFDITDCSILLRKLGHNENQLTKQLNSANSVISILKKEKSLLSGDLENCRAEYTSVTNNFVKITTEVKNVKKMLQDAIDDSAKLKTQWIEATADAQKWKTKSDSLESDLKRTVQNNEQLTITVNDYSTTITNLRSNIKEITLKNNKCETDSNEWKRKCETETAKVLVNERRLKELEASNGDLTSRITKLTDDLSNCRNGNKQNDIEIRKLKDTVADLTKQLSKCTVDLGTCNVGLNRVTDEFNADKLQDLEAEKRRAKLELQLGECVNRKKDVEQNLEAERKSVDKCKSEIVTIRGECSIRYQKYENNITELKASNKDSIDKCEASLKLEKDINANIRIEINSSKNRIGDLESKLTISMKNSDEWQKKNQFCQDDTINLKQTIETLRTNVAEVNKHLTTCVANGNSLQGELTLSNSKRDVCTGDLEGSRKKLADNEVIVSKLNNNIGALESAKKSCQAELSTLRCDVDQYLGNAKSAQEKAYDAALQVISILDGNKRSLGNFVNTHNTACRA